jgi:hypothetical protein
VGCLVGTGSASVPIIVDHQAALRSIQEIVPSIKDINNCPAVDELASLPIPLANGGGLVNLEALRSFFPISFLCNAILVTNLPSPLALILAVRVAQEEHIRKHGRDEDFDEGDINTHVDLFYLWCIGVHQGQVKETRFSIAPDDGKLAEWSSWLHPAHILPSIKAASTLPPSVTDTADLLRSHAAGISHTSKEAKHQNKIQCKQLNYIKEKEHPTSWHLVLNVASTDSNSPAEEIPASYLCIINSNTAGMADKELQSQMSELGHTDAGFAHGLAVSLYVGNILWNNRTTPSTLSPFTIFELDPLSTMQMAHCLHLHLLSKNTEGKFLDEIMS